MDDLNQDDICLCIFKLAWGFQAAIVITDITATHELSHNDWIDSLYTCFWVWDGSCMFFVLKRPTLWHCGTHLLVHLLRFRNFHIVHRCSAVTNSWRCSCVWQINATFRQALLQNAADLHGPFSCSPGPRAFFLVEHGSADGWTLALHGYFSAYT